MSQLPREAALRRMELVVALALSLLLLALHVIALVSAGPLWRDEISSLTLATKPTLSEAWRTLIYDPAPALFFLLLRGWHALAGDSDFALRVLGLLIGIAGLGAFWLAARLTGRRPPTLALALFGFCPTVFWNDTLRAYGLAVVTIVLAFACFWRLVRQPGGPIALVTLAVAVLSVQTLFTNALLIFACGSAAAIVALRAGQWRRALPVLAIGAISGLTLLPYASVLRATSDWADIRKAPVSYPEHFHVLGKAIAAGGMIFFWLALVLALAAMVYGGWRQFAKGQAGAPREAGAALYAVIAMVLGLGATMIFFRVLSWPTNIWYFLPLLALLALATDFTLDARNGARFFPVARSAMALLLAAIAFPHTLTRAELRASNLDQVAHALQAQSAPGDLFVLYPFTDGITFQRYAAGLPNWTTLPAIGDLSLHRWDQLMDALRRPEAIAPVRAQVEQTLRAGHRVWLVSTFPIYADRLPPPPVLPLSKETPHRLGYFNTGWHNQLMYDLTQHAQRMEELHLPTAQEVSPFEKARVFAFSVWQEEPAVPQS